ncbi:hypothetical protein CERZMDRAFT_101833 [Cercospora zeae-maydis SCOH1-5]|uniref:Uncharacterized protein n=1 Tax=Cercospora zeae-maydis SCOH1-5 TaxID=717836 RepID=A0A6A6F422_9PEZI|nr:hypothetical protein CERZMDRAFT_101833 [Cercospora zeae-maydis SCOH1-5]
MAPRASYKPYASQIQHFCTENNITSPFDMNATLFNQVYDIAQLHRPASNKQMANFFKYLRTTLPNDTSVENKAKAEAKLIEESLAQSSPHIPAPVMAGPASAPTSVVPDENMDREMSEPHDLADYEALLEHQRVQLDSSREHLVEREAKLEQRARAVELQEAELGVQTSAQKEALLKQVAHWKQEYEHSKTAYQQQVNNYAQKFADLTDSNVGLAQEIAELNETIAKLTADKEKLAVKYANISKDKDDIAEKNAGLMEAQAISKHQVKFLEVNRARESDELHRQHSTVMARAYDAKRQLQQSLEQLQSAIVLPASFIPVAVRDHAQRLRATGSEEAKLKFKHTCVRAAMKVDRVALKGMLLRVQAGVDKGVVFQSLTEVHGMTHLLRQGLPTLGEQEEKEEEKEQDEEEQSE